jgi:serine protease Do
MQPARRLWRIRSAVLLAAALCLAPPALGQAETRPAARPYVREPLAELKGAPSVSHAPRTPAELRAIQERVEVITRHALPAIVNIQITVMTPEGIPAQEQGSGVIISKDGYVLTAGHVSGEPGQDVTMVLSNGTRVAGKTLGANTQHDSGMIKITSRNNVEFPYMPIGSTAGMKTGEWVIALGHPGGLQAGRAPVLRLGKLLAVVDLRSRGGDYFIQTDCPLIMGDSGGPVFDIEGRVIGINSKIGLRTTSNIHVPIDSFTDTWERLAAGEKWGRPAFAGARPAPLPAPVTPPEPPKATLGARLASDGSTKVQDVRPGMSAERVGILPGDIITKLDNTIVKTFDDIAKFLAGRKPGEEITLELQRNGKPMQVKVPLDAADSR